MMKTAIPQDANTDLARLEAREFRRLVGLTFIFFFVIAAFSRLLPRPWRPFASASANRSESIYAEARRAAYTVIPFAFMR
jgi:hypothetical protein